MFGLSKINLTLLAIAAILFILLRLRKKIKRTPNLPERQISIAGYQLITEITLKTPLLCLLADGKKYGSDFREKEPPQLPHCDGCQCKLEEYSAGSRELFDRKAKRDETCNSDFGPLLWSEARYYKYQLLAAHPELSQEEKDSFSELAQKLDISKKFKKQVQERLARLS